MTYSKNVWKDQDVQRPRTYEVINNQDGSITLNDSFGVVTEIGTPVNATNMNHIEDGIADNDTAITTINSKIPNNASSVNKMITQEDVAPKFHALKSYSDNGELLTDAEGLEDVKGYAHSTFDRSKFAMSGATFYTKSATPSITNNGIFTNATTTDYIRYNVGSLPTTWGVKIKGKVPSTLPVSSSNTLLTVKDSIDGNILVAVRMDGNTSYLILGYRNSDGTYSISKYPSSGSLVANSDCLAEVQGNGSNIVIKINGETIVNGNDLNTSSNIQFFEFGSTSGGYNPWTGSVDLKYAEVDINGSVYTGNKTGIDTIKPDDYSVVGTPTITDDGIASGFSRGFVKFPFTLSTFNEIVIEISKDANSTGMMFSTDTQKLMIWQTSTNKVQFSWREVNSTTNVIVENFTVSADAQLYKFVLTSTTLSLYCDGVLNEIRTVTTTGLAYTFTYGIIGNYHPTTIDNFAFTGSIDLNALKIYVDGNLVYQPCLKIPYTKGSEQYGGKYVNAQYLPRVKDAYEQGLANDYFTLDEVNGTYTLPMGNLYGMIEKLNQLAKDEIGLPKATLSNTLNDNEIWLEGAEVSKVTYAKLYAIYGDDYGIPSDSANFVLPDFRDRVMQGIGSGGTFGYISAGLPNIKGTTTKTGIGINGTAGTFTGAFTNSVSGTGNDVQGGSDNTQGFFNGQLKFNANNSNSIYKDSVTTVQPPAIKVRFKTRFQ